MPAPDSKPGQLQPVPSTSSSCTFKPPSSPGKLDGLGLNPIHKVRVRPAVIKKKQKPTALDKHCRHVILIQRHNRQKAQQQHQQQLQQQQQQQDLAEFTHQLRTLILSGNAEAVQHTWKPAAAAVCLQETQAAAAEQTELVKRTIPLTIDPMALKVPDSYDALSRTTNIRTTSPSVQKSAAATGAGAAAKHSATATYNSSQAGPAAEEEEQGSVPEDDDVDSFLDGLLQQAAATKSSNSSDSKMSHNTTAAAAAATRGGNGSRPGSAQAKQQQQRFKLHKPAWALTEQQQTELELARSQETRLADSAQVVEEAEEAELLEFAEQLSWEELVGQLDDEQLAAVFKELDAAEQHGAAAAAAAGDPSSDQQWRRCFVAAVNHAAMKDIAAATAAAGGSAGGGSRCGDEQERRSEMSSASQARRAEAVAARRQKLLDRLTRLDGAASTAAAAAAAAGGGGSLGGWGGTSVCGSRAPAGKSQLGERSSMIGCAAAAADEWDRSTRAGGNEVAHLQAALKTVEAAEVLVENPDMKGVHSVASVRSMLQKLEGQS